MDERVEESSWLARAMEHRGTRLDPRLATLFASARVEREREPARRWGSSHGEVRAFHATLWVTAEGVADCARAPSVMDGVVAALSAAAAQDPGTSLEGVSVRWGRVGREEGGYRDVPARDLARQDERELRAELLRYCARLGEGALGAALTRARVKYDGATLTVEGLDAALRHSALRSLAPLAPTVLAR